MIVFLVEFFWFVFKLLWILKDCSYSNMEYKKNSRLVLLFIYFLFMLMKKIDVKMILFL